MFETTGPSGPAQSTSTNPTKKATEHKPTVFYQVDLTENDEGQALKTPDDVGKKSNNPSKTTFDQ